jgi:DnaJ-domain-containing protein 1
MEGAQPRTAEQNGLAALVSIETTIAEFEAAADRVVGQGTLPSRLGRLIEHWQQMVKDARATAPVADRVERVVLGQQLVADIAAWEAEHGIEDRSGWLYERLERIQAHQKAVNEANDALLALLRSERDAARDALAETRDLTALCTRYKEALELIHEYPENASLLAYAALFNQPEIGSAGEARVRPADQALKDAVTRARMHAEFIGLDLEGHEDTPADVVSWVLEIYQQRLSAARVARRDLEEGIRTLVNELEDDAHTGYGSPLVADRIRYLVKHYRSTMVDALASAQEFRNTVVSQFRALSIVIATVGGAGTHREKDARLRGLDEIITASIDALNRMTFDALGGSYWPDVFRSDFATRELIREKHQLRDEVKMLRQSLAEAQQGGGRDCHECGEVFDSPRCCVSQSLPRACRGARADSDATDLPPPLPF